MDTVRFDIALGRNPPRPRSAPSPTPSATVPSLPQNSTPQAKPNEHLSVPISTRIDSPVNYEAPLLKESPKQTLSDRFHDWMEMDLEHGL
jgi:hypothetical protein